MTSEQWDRARKAYPPRLLQHPVFGREEEVDIDLLLNVTRSHECDYWRRAAAARELLRRPFIGVLPTDMGDVSRLSAEA